MLQTVHGSLYIGLEVERAKNLLVRGATSSIGFAAISMARGAGLEVTATTRSSAKSDELKAAGATHVIVDDGAIAKIARNFCPDGYDRILELVGTTILLDSLQAARRGGIVCMNSDGSGLTAISRADGSGGPPNPALKPDAANAPRRLALRQASHKHNLRLALQNNACQRPLL